MQTLETYEKAFAALPSSLRSEQRQAAFDHFMSKGLPTRQSESWKYTDLSRLKSLAPDISLIKNDVSLELSSDADAIESLNAAFCSGGLDEVVTSDTPSGQVVLASGAGHRRHRIRVAANVSAVIALDIDPAADFQTVLLDLHLEAGSKVYLHRFHKASSSSRHITRVRASLDRDSLLDASTIDLGGMLSRHELNVDLVGPGSEIRLRSLFVCSDKEHIDNQTRFDHRAPHCTSYENIRGMARDTSRGVFNGRIVVHPEGQKTDSEQRIASLILSPKAEIDAKPELEIYADDVKCAHGATFGQIDDKALFYLRSRGIPEAEARALLTLAFAMEPLRKIPHDAFRQSMIAHVVKHLGANIDDTVLA
tara:strand:- start:387 stop:1481 length:1095 start_codon:yes stop_codon:yes gene_type:complete